MMLSSNDIRFGTDGWRALIGGEFTAANVARVAEATAKWLSGRRKKTLSAVIGYDCRFGGEFFAHTAAKTLALNGVKAIVGKNFSSTPMVSYACRALHADAGIVITASHNPPQYNGFKLKGPYGGPLLPAMVKEVEALIPSAAPEPALSHAEGNWDVTDLSEWKKRGLIEEADLEAMYCEAVRRSFNLKAIRKNSRRFAYDAMYGAGQNVLRKLLPGLSLLHCDYNPSFGGTPPEPIHRNLLEFSRFIAGSRRITCGLATDGDADRLGMYDGDGKFVDAHHLILLLIHYLCKYRKMRGKVVVAFSTTVNVHKLCEHYGLPVEIVPIGFKHICEIMLKEDLLLGGEESGGIALKGHIPERDGIWCGLTLWEFMAKSGKSLKELIREVYAITGPFAFERIDLRIREEDKQRILEKCREGSYQSFGKYKVIRTEDLDGYKFFFSDTEWLMLRASGTEPLLRTYAEAANRRKALDILRTARETIAGT